MCRRTILPIALGVLIFELFVRGSGLANAGPPFYSLDAADPLPADIFESLAPAPASGVELTSAALFTGAELAALAPNPPNIDSLSGGNDFIWTEPCPILPAADPGKFAGQIYFWTVDRASVGALPGGATVIHSGCPGCLPPVDPGTCTSVGSPVPPELPADGAAADIFTLTFNPSLPLPLAQNLAVVLVKSVDEGSLGLAGVPAAPIDEMDALEEAGAIFGTADFDTNADNVPEVDVFFSLDGATAAGIGGISAADLLVVPAGAGPAGRIVYATAAALGLVPGDDIDALCVSDTNTTFGDDANDVVLVSLAPGAPSLGGFSAADVFRIATGDPYPGSGLVVPFLPAAYLSLLATDNLDGLHCNIGDPGSLCGDGVRNPLADEECDDGASCSIGSLGDPSGGAPCALPACLACAGGSSVACFECECTQDGSATSAGSCLTRDGDGCSATCKDELCGNGVLGVARGEECDDANLVNCDGCSTVCQLEPVLEPLSKEQQKCVSSINKGAAKVAKAQAGANATCIKDGSKEKLSGTIEQCIASDPKGKIQQAISKIKTGDCSAPPACPAIDTNAESIGQIMIQKDLDLIHAIFGSDLDTVVVNAAADKPGAKCQAAIAKAVGKCQDAKLKVFNGCKKNALAVGKEPVPNGAVSASALQDACLGTGTSGIPDPKGKIAKKCFDGLDATIFKKCGSPDDNDALFPPCAGQDLTACLDQKIECEVCKALNALDGLFRNCDEFDDGTTNGSCQ